MEISNEIIYNLLKRLAPTPEEVELKIEDLPKLIGKVKNSEEALKHFCATIGAFGYPAKKIARINCGTWKCNVVWDIRDVGYLISFKSFWLYEYGKIFNRPERMGTGLNKVIAEYCKHLDVDNFIIVIPNSNIYQYSIKKLIEYSEKFGTERIEQGWPEIHIPLEELNLFTIGGGEVKPFTKKEIQQQRQAQ